jgi:methylated-DNA-[protein]-cysteine S-methyltransferase
VIELGSVATPLARARFARRDGRLLAFTFDDYWPTISAALARRLPGVPLRDGAAPGELAARLDAYFAGELASLDAIDVELVGTPFQRAVWATLRGVRAGATTTYGALARALGRPSASRAVGAANGANPLWLIVPCHRVIGSDGALTGYAGGLQRKAWLLEHERRSGPAVNGTPSTRSR